LNQVLQIEGLTKHFGGVLALDSADLTVDAGSIHAIVGENGAGKSTLMRILAGAEYPDAGAIRLFGRDVSISSPLLARHLGIGVVYQELSVFPDRTVAANILVGVEPTTAGLIDRKQMRRRAAEVLDRLRIDVDPETPVGRLSVGERQLVELCRVILQSPRLLLLDEPNSALTARETDRLFDVLRDLQTGGMTILYVSHRLEEVFEIADQVTVMRNGRVVMNSSRVATSIPAVVSAMVGTQLSELFPKRTKVELRLDGPTLSVQGLHTPELESVSFSARAGEVVGLAGLEGSGVETLLETLFGLRRPLGGQATYPDGLTFPRSPTEAVARGICLVPADRRRHGLMLAQSVAFNIAHVEIGTRTRKAWVTRGLLASIAQMQIGRLSIRTPSPWATADSLSGGNQQKVVLAKWLQVAPKVILLDDPTRGVDVGAKKEIYLQIRRLAGDGHVVVMTSSELEEFTGLADRILAVYRGRVVGEYPGGQISTIGLLHAINTGDLVG
jgi:ribose transport system ATP-binding protein